MKAVRMHTFGGPEVLQLENVDVPRAGPGELLLRVHAAGINPVDYKLRQRSSEMLRQDRLPITLGREVSGIVEHAAATGPYRVGDAVFALLDWTLGGYAQYVAVRADSCAPKPRVLDFNASGAVPLAGLTAWQGLFEHGGLKRGQRVLVHAGAGGVGHFAIQFARTQGATVLTTVSGHDRQFARELGAETVIDYKTERFEDAVHDVDMVFDLVGGETRERSWQVLKPGGILVSTLGEPDARAAKEHGVRSAGYMTEPNREQLAAIGRLIDDGAVRVVLTRTFALDDAREAHRFLESQHPRGKIAFAVAA